MDSQRDSFPPQAERLGWGSFAVAAMMLISDVAAAHTAIVPHQHPHEASALPGLDAFALAILAAGMIILAIGKFKRSERP